MIEAKTKEIEAKCLSKAEIKELITDDCSKNPCQNVKRTSRPAFQKGQARPKPRTRNPLIRVQPLPRPGQSGDLHDIKFSLG